VTTAADRLEGLHRQQGELSIELRNLAIQMDRRRTEIIGVRPGQGQPSFGTGVALTRMVCVTIGLPRRERDQRACGNARPTALKS